MSRQKGKGMKRKRSWHRRGSGPDWAFRRAMKKLTKEEQPMTTLHESPCGEAFSTPEDATSHQWHCDQCAGVVENIRNLETELAQPTLPGL